MNGIGAQFCITDEGFSMTDISRENIAPRTPDQVVVHFTNGHAMVVSMKSEFYGPEGRTAVHEFNTKEPVNNIVNSIIDKFNNTRKLKWPYKVPMYKLGIYVARGPRSYDFLYTDRIPDKYLDNVTLPKFPDGRVKVYVPLSTGKFTSRISRGERVCVLNWANWSKKMLQEFVTGYLDFKVHEVDDNFVIYYRYMTAPSQLWAMLAALEIPAELKAHRLTYTKNNLYNEIVIPKSQALLQLTKFIYITEESKDWPDIKINKDPVVYYKNTYKYIFQSRLLKFIYDTPTPPYDRSN